jgi:O-antigen/teichoic acid export membrane protein
MGKIWRFGRYGMFTNISVSIITSTDHLMLGGMISTSSVAIYNVAVKITNFFNLPSVALSSVLLPQGVQTAANNDIPKLRNIFESAVAATLTGLIPSVLLVLLFPEFIIDFIAGPNYYMAKEILLIIIFTTFIMPFFQSYGMIVNALGKPRLDFIFILTISLLNIVANYLLIKSLGINGAAYASLLTHLVGLLFVLLVLRKMIGVNLISIAKKVLNMYVRLYSMVLQKLKPSANG